MARKAVPKKTDLKRTRRMQAASLENLKKGKGRPPGVPNKATLEVKAFCNAILTDPRYVASIWRRIKADSLAGSVEQLFYYYAAGKPKETIGVEASSLAELLAAAVRRPDPEG